MRLRLQFSGMQLFVPMPHDAVPHVSVVMPRSEEHHGSDQHIPVLAVRPGYLTKESTQEGRGWFLYPLRGCILTIPEGNDINVGICPQILNLSEVTPLQVDPDVFGANSSGKAVARVDLHAGRMSRVERGACWFWASAAARPAAHVAEWEVNWPGDSVTLPLRRWTGENLPLPDLYPLKDTDVVEVSILHLPAADLSLEDEMESVPEPMPGNEAPHFGAYYSVLDGYGPEGRPRFAAIECSPLPGECPPIEYSGGSPFNCMLATISPPPEG